MSRSGPESEGQVLKVDQKKRLDLKTDKQIKNEMLLKHYVIWMPHDNKRYLNLIIFHFYAISAFIIALAKIIKQTLSSHDVQYNYLCF